jgi:glucosylceramidase
VFLARTRSVRPARLAAALAAGAALSACADLPSPVGAPAMSGGAYASVWLTTPDGAQLLAPQPEVRFDGGDGGAQVAIDVDETARFQTMAGFGAAVTGSAAWLIQQRLPEAERAALMRALFDPREGIGLSFVRTTMGASDFSLRDYTYADLPPGESDPALRRFSINPDRAELLPVLREARRINPELRVMATPWSAPAWMKTSGSLAGGSLRREAYGAYAEYFRRFLDAYAREGVPVYAVSVQNEPMHEAPYPSMRMSPGEQAAFVRDHLGPTLAAHGMATRILAWDHNWDGVDFPLAVFGDAGAARYLAGAAFHCYAGDVSAQSRFRDAFAGKEVFFTECSGGQWSPDFATNLLWNLKHLVIGATRNWSSSVILWNLALDPRGGPANGGCTDCRGVVTVDPHAGRATRNVEFYVLGHASKFVRPGAVRIGSTDSGPEGLENVAFRNPDGSTALIVLNPTGGGRSFRVRGAQGTFRYVLPAGAAATFVWS